MHMQLQAKIKEEAVCCISSIVLTLSCNFKNGNTVHSGVGGIVGWLDNTERS